MFLTVFFEEPWFKNCVFLLLDEKHNIVNMSKNAEEFLGIQHVNYEAYFHINEYIENFDENFKDI